MEGIASGKEISEVEHLSTQDKYHDYLITSLRTRSGADPEHIERTCGKRFRIHFEKQTRTFLKSGVMFHSNDRLVLDPEGWLISDYILRALFMD